MQYFRFPIRRTQETPVSTVKVPPKLRLEIPMPKKSSGCFIRIADRAETCSGFESKSKPRNLSMNVVQAVVHGRVKTVKTDYSEDELPLDPGFRGSPPDLEAQV